MKTRDSKNQLKQPESEQGFTNQNNNVILDKNNVLDPTMENNLKQKIKGNQPQNLKDDNLNPNDISSSVFRSPTIIVNFRNL